MVALAKILNVVIYLLPFVLALTFMQINYMDYKLFMLLLGCRPDGRNTEQHDIFFGIAKQLRDLIPEIKSFWKASGKIHLDGWRVVNNVDGYAIRVLEKTKNLKQCKPFRN